MTNNIPLIDIAPLIEGEPCAKNSIAQAIDEALQNVGFFTIVGHGVSEDLINLVRDQSYEFFNLSIDEKMKVKRPLPEITRGYDPPAQQSLAATKDGAGPPDLIEGFGMGGFSFPVDDPYYTAGLGHYFFAPNIWPKEPKGLRNTLEEYHSRLTLLSARLMRVFAYALNLEETFFDNKIDKTGAHIRLNKYPRQDAVPAPAQLRSGAHTDYGTLTILYGEDTPGGLQVMSPEGYWVDVHPQPGSFVVNIGDSMARWTNDRWLSTLHRVTNPPREYSSSERLSVAFFHAANYDAEIRCLESCKSKNKPARYEPIHYAAYYIDKLMKSRQTVNI